MASKTGQVTIDGIWRDVQITGNLAIGHAAEGFHEDQAIEVWHFLPVGCAEGLSTEVAVAVQAGKALDAVGWLLAFKKPGFFERPAHL